MVQTFMVFNFNYDFPNQLIFLGTGGARFVVFSQQRASGGLWLTLQGIIF